MNPRLQLIRFGQMVDGIEGRKSLARNHDWSLAWGRCKGDNYRAILIRFVFLTTEPNGCILDTFFSFINDAGMMGLMVKTTYDPQDPAGNFFLSGFIETDNCGSRN